MMMPQSIGPMNGLTICTQANTRKASSVSRITRSMNRSRRRSRLPGPSARLSVARAATLAQARRGPAGARIRLPAGRWCGRRRGCARSGPRPAGRRTAVFLDRLLRLASVDLPGASGSNTTRSAGAPFASRPASRPRIRAGASVMVRSSRQQADLAVVHQSQAHRQQGLQADDAAGRLGERQALAVLVLRAMVGGDGVDRAVLERLDHGQPVLLGAQRRRQLGEGAVVPDRELVQREIVRGRVAGDPQPARLGGADRGDRAGGRDVREVQPAAGQLERAGGRARP